MRPTLTALFVLIGGAREVLRHLVHPHGDAERTLRDGGVVRLLHERRDRLVIAITLRSGEASRRAEQVRPLPDLTGLLQQRTGTIHPHRCCVEVAELKMPTHSER